MTPQTWFITGTSSGFGRRITEILLERGHKVAATARKPEVLSELAAQYPERMWTIPLDVTDTAAARYAVEKAFAHFERIDVVLNNAGYGLFGAAEELSDNQINKQIDTNLIGSIQITRAAIPYMRAQGGGHIIQISSMAGQMGWPGYSLYHASKWGIEGFLEAVMLEVAPFGIQITIVEPGSARTEFIGESMDSGVPLDIYNKTPVADMRERRRLLLSGEAKRPGDPEKMAHAIIAMAAQKNAPRRLALGSDAYRLVHAALSNRLGELEAQKETALSTDADDMLSTAD